MKIVVIGGTGDGSNRHHSAPGRPRSSPPRQKRHQTITGEGLEGRTARRW
jgi:hypothetical protein